MRLTNLIATAAIAMSLAACSNDQESADAPMIPSDPAIGEAYASFNINIASHSGRAEADANATESESAISALKLYIFNNGIFEQSCTPTLNGQTTEPVATKVGEKVVFAVTGTAPALAVTDGMNIDGFRRLLFNSGLSDIAAENNFVMIGQSDAKLIARCSKTDIPASNKFEISVTRAAAKAQVMYGSGVSISEQINATFATPQFALRQLARQMYVGYNAGFTPGSTGASADGLYNGYDANSAAPYLNAVTSAFTAAGCGYAAENRVESPTTGNTTFASLKFKMTPAKTYAYDAGSSALTDDNTALADDGTFYAVARENSWHGTVVYATDSDYKIAYFATEEKAAAYAEALNEAFNLTEPEGENADQETGIYKSVKFDGGTVFYRVNLITDNTEGASLSSKYRVDRNSFYQINITKINALGQYKEIVPENPDEPLESDAWIECTISVAPWTVVPQDVELN